MVDFLEKLMSWACSFGQDKYVHFICGQVIFVIWAVIFLGLGIHKCPAFIVSGIITFAAAIGKEVIDKKYRTGIFDIKDALATILGGLLGYLETVLILL